MDSLFRRPNLLMRDKAPAAQTRYSEPGDDAPVSYFLNLDVRFLIRDVRLISYAMPPQGLNPGDRVVELAALTVSAAVATGAVAGAWIVWLIKKSWLASAGSLIAGAIVGFAAGQLVARLLDRTAAGNTSIVKVGSASLSATITAGLAGGITTAMAVGLLALLIFSARNQALSLRVVAIGCGVVFGVLFACLGSLT